MSQRRKAQILTVLVMAAALGVAAYRKGAIQVAWPVPARPVTPQDTIYSMFDAAREGNVRAYLAAHTGQMAAALEKSVAESGEAGFANYLKQTSAPVKGIALQDPQPLTDREVKVRVEYVFQDRNEVQFFYLEKSGDSWKVERVDSAERLRTLVPYGTPVK